VNNLAPPADLQIKWQEFASLLYEGQTILDLGAGQGKSKGRLERNGLNQVTTQDINRNLMLCVDLIMMPEDIQGEWDVVTAFDVIEHVPNPHILLSEMLRLAQKEIFFSTPNKTLFPTPWHYTFDELTNMLSGIKQSCADILLYGLADRKSEVTTIDIEHFVGEEWQHFGFRIILSGRGRW